MPGQDIAPRTGSKGKDPPILSKKDIPDRGPGPGIKFHMENFNSSAIQETVTVLLRYRCASSNSLILSLNMPRPVLQLPHR